MNAITRDKIETSIVRCLIGDAIAAGCTVRVYDGETFYPHSKNMTEILSQMFAVGDEQLTFYDAAGNRIGWVRLIYGNGPDVICDYSTTMPDSIMAGANKLADEYDA